MVIENTKYIIESRKANIVLILKEVIESAEKRFEKKRFVCERM